MRLCSYYIPDSFCADTTSGLLHALDRTDVAARFLCEILILSFTCNFFAYFKMIAVGPSNWIKQNELDCRDIASFPLMFL